MEFPNYDAEATRRLLPWEGLLGVLRSMLRAKRAGEAHAPERLGVPLQGGILLAMPAADREFASTKLVTVHADNPRRGLPSILGEVILMRADTGERLLMLDGPTVTARRTAAMSALAARTLAPGNDGPMLVVGAGTQGRAHVEAFASALGVRRVWIASRTRSSAEALAAHAASLGLRADAIDDPARVLPEARIVVTGTTASAPVIPDAVRDDAFVAAVGAFRPEMCELPASLVRRAALYVDDAAGARHEAGDLIQAGIDWSRVTALEDAVDSPTAAARGAPVVFKSVGQALWDLAACRLAHSVSRG